MPKRSHVYLLSTYDEHGAEQVHATLDPSKLPGMLRTLLNAIGNVPASTGWDDTYESEAITTLDMMLGGLKAHNSPIREAIDLHPSGWGGIQLHVVPLFA